MKTCVFALLLTTSFIAAAQNMYRCTGTGGVASYQDTPCNKEMQIIKSVQAAPTTVVAPGAKIGKNTAMDEAYQRHMAAGEFSLAKSFAVSDTQRNIAMQKEAQLRAQCASMLINVQEAQANNKHRNGQLQHRAEAAQSQYNLKCAQ